MSKTKIAAVGCGYWGKNLVRNLHQLGNLAMVCESNEAHQETARRLAPGVPIVSDFEHVLVSDVAGVVLATPAETHYKLASQSLSSGKDTFVEKPLALTLEEGLKLVEQAGRERILMVGHILEYHPACQRMCQLAQSGELGEIRYIYSNRLSLGKVRREENILWSFAPHDVALAIRLAGSMPKQVAAYAGTFLQANIADVTVTNLVFPGNIRGHIHVSWLHPFKEQRLVVIGSEKMASFNGIDGRLTCYDQRVDFEDGEPMPRRGEGLHIPVPTDEPLRRECQAFIQAIETRRPPLTDGLNGLQVLSVLEAAQRSLEHHGALQRVDPVSHSVKV